MKKIAANFALLFVALTALAKQCRISTTKPLGTLAFHLLTSVLTSLCWAQSPSRYAKQSYFFGDQNRIRLTSPHTLTITENQLGQDSAVKDKVSNRKTESQALDIKKIFFMGGTHGGGGGGGVACFSSALTKADRTSSALLQKKMETDLKSLSVFDYWKFVKTTIPLNEENYHLSRVGESPHDYLFRILKAKSGILSPRFVQILKEAIQTVSPRQHMCKSMPLIDDLGPDQWLHEENIETVNCARVQLARRLFDPATDQYKFEYNCSLYTKLGKGERPEVKTINQAVLILHEALYLMGNRLLSAMDSNSVQELAIELIRKDWPGYERDRTVFRRLLRMVGFDDFFILPLKGNASQVRVGRLQAYYDLIEKLSVVLEKFNPVSPLDDPYGKAISIALPRFEKEIYAVYAKTIDPAQALIEQKIFPSLSPEQAFILAAGTLATNFDFDFESLFLHGNDSNALETVCAFATGDSSRLTGSVTIDQYVDLQKLQIKGERDFQLLRGRIESYCHQSRTSKDRY